MAVIGGLSIIIGSTALYYLINSRQNKRKLKKMSNEEVLSYLERRIQKAEGSNNVGSIRSFLPAGQLYKASLSLLRASRIVIVTGFPSHIDYSPPTSTNGPLGTTCLAKALLAIGKNVIIATDESNENVILQCIQSSGITSSNLKLESFPARSNFSHNDHERLSSLAYSTDLVVFINRPGPSPDGTYRTDKGININHLVAPFEMMLPMSSVNSNSYTSQTTSEKNSLNNTPTNSGKYFASTSGKSEPEKEKMQSLSVKSNLTTTSVKLCSPSMKMIPSISVGEYGNELGMGKIYDQIVHLSSIPMAKQIVCVVPTDQLIVSTVSDWGGFALATSVAVMASADSTGLTSNQTSRLSSTQGTDGLSNISTTGNTVNLPVNDIGEKVIFESREEALSSCILSNSILESMLSTITREGARDKESGEKIMKVNGLGVSVMCEVMNDLRAIALKLRTCE